MHSYIHAIATAVPETVYTQDYAKDFMKRHVATQRAAALTVQRIYAHSGIQKRHSAIRDFAPGAESGLFFDADKQVLLNPGTGERNQLYTEAASRLFADVSAQALAASPFAAADVTHVITASCTGFFAPGPDWLIIGALGLAPTTCCYHLGFMGCYAAFPAMRLAQDITATNPHAVVLIVCLELCTLHLQFTQDPDALLSASLFADGAGAALMSARPPAANRAAFAIQSLDTNRTTEGAEDMVWTIGNHGFDMTLSTRVPAIIRDHLPPVMALYAQRGFATDAFAYWAVHPGGRAILDTVQTCFNLDAPRLQASRDTLREYGNMSSATIWFVLQHILAQPMTAPAPLIAMAFGPGLTIETGCLTLIPASAE